MVHWNYRGCGPHAFQTPFVPFARIMKRSSQTFRSRSGLDEQPRTRPWQESTSAEPSSSQNTSKNSELGSGIVQNSSQLDTSRTEVRLNASRNRLGDIGRRIEQGQFEANRSRRHGSDQSTSARRPIRTAVGVPTRPTTTNSPTSSELSGSTFIEALLARVLIPAKPTLKKRGRQFRSDLVEKASMFASSRAPKRDSN